MRRLFAAALVLGLLAGCGNASVTPSPTAEEGLFPTITPGEGRRNATIDPNGQRGPVGAIARVTAGPDPTASPSPEPDTPTPPPTFTVEPTAGENDDNDADEGDDPPPTFTMPPPEPTDDDPPRPTSFLPTPTGRPTATPQPPTLAPPAGPTLSPDRSGQRSELTGDEEAAAGTMVYGGMRCLLSTDEPECGCRPDALDITFEFPDPNRMRQITPTRGPGQPQAETTYTRIGFNAWQAEVATETGLNLIFTLEFRPNGFDQQVDATYPGGEAVTCVNRWNR